MLRYKDIFVSGTSGYHTFRIPSLIAAKNGDLLAFCEGRRDGNGDSGVIEILLRRSQDGGENWSPIKCVWANHPNTCGNPCPVLDQTTGLISLLMTHNLGCDAESEIIDKTSKGTRTVHLSRSIDNGHTWSTPANITSTTKKEDWTWYATGPGAGIQLITGRLLIPCDHIEAISKRYYSHVIISDDGLQHYQLRRDFEIAVIDGARGFGNGLLLPAGPLREPVARLSDVDAVLVNGIDRWGVAPERATSFSLIPEALIDAKTRQSISIKQIAKKRVRAVAGIGNPKRFFETLRDLGALVIEHPWPDHAPLSDDDLQFGDDVPIVITDKDFHRCKRLDFSMIKAPVYVLKVRVDLPAYLIEDIMSHVTSVLDRH